MRTGAPSAASTAFITRFAATSTMRSESTSIGSRVWTLLSKRHVREFGEPRAKQGGHLRREFLRRQASDLQVERTGERQGPANHRFDLAEPRREVVDDFAILGPEFVGGRPCNATFNAGGNGILDFMREDRRGLSDHGERLQHGALAARRPVRLPRRPASAR
jgi:hypothetical protein